jgi:tetratricopeptide (TPR) repeat protein
LSDLGEAYLQLDQTDDALASLRQSLSIWRSIGNRHGEATTLHRLGIVLGSAGNVAQAREVFGQALALLEQLGDRARAAQVRIALTQDVTQAG